MAISTEDQAAVWALPETELSDNAKTVFGVMSDHPDFAYGPPVAETISTQLGNSLTVEEATAALNELYQKGYIQFQGILPQYPPLMPSPT
jgi:hypothetical protein